MIKSHFAIAVRVASIAMLLVGSFGCVPNPVLVSIQASPTAPASIPITISSSVPSELNPGDPKGAQTATMQQAAAFAWQEFIALNWPAQTKNPASGMSQRETADPNCKFGDTTANCVDSPLVWETFRGKDEIFPGQGTPAGYNPSPPNAPTEASLGYDASPSYVYGTDFTTPGLAAGVVPACDSSQASDPAAWVNLDETDQIGIDSMFAGVVDAASANKGNSAPQLIRFLAKANRTEYNYIAIHKWFSGTGIAGNPALYNKTLQYLETHQASPPDGSGDYASLPNGTIEIKAGWRVLNKSELDSGRFKTATVRYYEKNTNTSDPSPRCYLQDTFGLVALHIIQKTPTAPYFIYATFEQADNILTSDGKFVEDADGNLIQPLATCPSSQNCSTAPSVTLDDSPTTTPPPPQVNLVPLGAPYCATPKSQLYYLNISSLPYASPALPIGGNICINYRDNLIPPVVIAANQTAHAAMTAYNQPGSPWLYYKLINVQYQPIDKNYAGIYDPAKSGDDPNGALNASSYHLANIVVETNRPLQFFSGGLANSFTNSDYDINFTGSGTPLPPPMTIHRNMYYGGGQYNMGGCMGCHGSQGQHQGGDFSVILKKGRVLEPEIPATP